MWVRIFSRRMPAVLVIMYQAKGAITMGILLVSIFWVPASHCVYRKRRGYFRRRQDCLTAIFTGIAFFISLFFAPIFASIPPWATRCTLIIVGSLMAKSAADINWRYYGDAVPAFIAIAVMSFTYSMAYSLIAGIITYMA
jgi:AGZA family xanthine/uracil permease-like MFS transporter